MMLFFALIFLFFLSLPSFSFTPPPPLPSYFVRSALSSFPGFPVAREVVSTPSPTIFSSPVPSPSWVPPPFRPFRVYSPSDLPSLFPLQTPGVPNLQPPPSPFFLPSPTKRRSSEGNEVSLGTSSPLVFPPASFSYFYPVNLASQFLFLHFPLSMRLSRFCFSPIGAWLCDIRFSRLIILSGGKTEFPTEKFRVFPAVMRCA